MVISLSSAGSRQSSCAGGKQEGKVLGESGYHGASAFVAWFSVAARTQKITASEAQI